MTGRPIALTMGDPSGIGPEIALKAWDRLRGELPFFLIGDFAHMSVMADGVPIEQIAKPGEAPGISTRALPVLQHDLAAVAQSGVPMPQNAASVIEIIRLAASMAMDGRASAMVTNPINKKMLHDGAGFGFPGHTEFLAALGNAPRAVMMLSAKGIRVVPVTIHIALSEVPGALTPELLRETIRITNSSLMSDYGIKRPRIAVAGLNPHAGEGGNMGNEEINWIALELERLRAEGMAIAGPLAADTMFHARARAGYDVAVCMYHDQALIPVKTIDFANAVNITLGLPFVRTSPDHGTAYDIAGQGIADPGSLIAALRQASAIAKRREAAE